jgi:hypothetical protein
MKLADLFTDHSFVHDDFQAYYMSTGKEEMITTDYKQHPDTWMSPMKHADKSNVVEIPASWTLDDWPPFQWDAARPNAVSLTFFSLIVFAISTVTRFSVLTSRHSTDTSTRIVWNECGKSSLNGAIGSMILSYSQCPSIHRSLDDRIYYSCMKGVSYLVFKRSTEC